MRTPTPDYADPPVIEVVCGVNFSPLDRFKTVHVGKLWERFQTDFPEVQEQPPLATVVEYLDTPVSPPMEIQFVDTPPLPRVWFLDKTGNGIIQVQRDAFLHNWRKLTPSDQYPRYRTVMGNYENHLKQFQEFIKEHSLGSIALVQCELTYVNHIFESSLWSQGKLVSELFPDFFWRKLDDRFLPGYESANWRTAFRLPENCGRLHVSLQTAVRRSDNKPLVILEMKTRGIGKDRSLDSLPKWFEMAHEWIVFGFADLTSDKAQNDLWRRKL